MNILEMEFYSNEELAELEKNGVIFIDKLGVYISKDTEIGEGTVIYPFVRIHNSKIGKNNIIGSYTNMYDSKIGDNNEILGSNLEEAIVENDNKIGPNSRLRPKSHICNNCKIGNFVEVKNSVIGNNTKASHLAYIGDADLGENINVSCGVIFANYDGKNKFRSIIEDNVFLGSNANIVAPVKIENNSYIAAGSTVTKSIPKDSLVIARSKEYIKENWNKKD